MYRDAFVNNVNRFLASFRGNHVRYFHLRFCLTSSGKDDMDEWIRFAIRMAVKVMGVALYCQRGTGSALRTLDDDDSELSFEDDHYVMGTELFDTTQCNLKCLQLCGCNLRPNFAEHDDCVPNCLKVFDGVTRLEWYFLERSRLGIAKMVSILKAFPLLRELLVLVSLLVSSGQLA